MCRDGFERRTLTESGLFALFSRDFEQIFGQIFFIRIQTLSTTNLVASRHIKREKSSLRVDVHGSKTLLLKVSNTLTIYELHTLQPAWQALVGSFGGFIMLLRVLDISPFAPNHNYNKILR